MIENTSKPVILVTNDDGVTAKGIKSLVEALRGLGEIVVVAPDGPRSGQSGAITPNLPLRLKKVTAKEELTVYACNGTPVDCVKLALNQLLDRKPDLIAPGINLATNSAISILNLVTYSAVSGVCLLYVLSVGISLCPFTQDADFVSSPHYVRTIASYVL